MGSTTFNANHEVDSDHALVPHLQEVGMVELDEEGMRLVCLGRV